MMEGKKQHGSIFFGIVVLEDDINTFLVAVAALHFALEFIQETHIGRWMRRCRVCSILY